MHISNQNKFSIERKRKYSLTKSIEEVFDKNSKSKMASGKALSFSLLFMALAVVSILPEPVYAQPNMKRGWTMNSVGYNAGLDALEKIFGGFSKRNDVMTSDEGKISMSSTQQEILQLLSEVLTLKKLQEQGVFEPALIRCLSQQSQQHDE